MMFKKKKKQFQFKSYDGTRNNEFFLIKLNKITYRIVFYKLCLISELTTRRRLNSDNSK